LFTKVNEKTVLWSTYTLRFFTSENPFMYCHAAAEDFLGEDEFRELYREVTPFRLFDVPEVLEVHEVPAEEVRMVPESPTVIKMSSP
jgi:hypothetical protein